MTELEQEVRAELTRLRAAVSYVEEANQHTAEALEAAATTKSLNEQLQGELQDLQQRLAQLETIARPSSNQPLALLPVGVSSILLLGCATLLWIKRK